MSRPSAGVNGKATRLRRSDRFLAGLEEASLVTFVSHVNPDPDSLGSMLGLSYMVETCLGKPTRLVRDGLISRAENQAMVELLDIDLVPIEAARWRRDEALRRTAALRPDLMAALPAGSLDDRDREVLHEAGFPVPGEDMAH